MEDNSDSQDVGSCSSVNNETPRRKRGPYKLYLAPSDTGNSVAVPRTTKWRRLQTGDDHESQREELFADAHNVGADRGTTEVDIFADNTEPRDESDSNVGGTLNDSDFNILGYDYEHCCQEVNYSQDDSCQEEDSFQDQSNTDDGENEIENDQPQIDEPLYDGAQVTVAQCLLLLMAFMLGNNLSGAAIGNLLKLLALILPTDSQLPRTKFLFDKYFNAFKDGVQFKLYCPTCNALLTGFEALKCTICEATYQNSTGFSWLLVTCYFGEDCLPDVFASKKVFYYQKFP